MCVCVCDLNGMNTAALPWKPAVQSGWPADQVEVVGFVDSQSFVDVAMRVDVRSHGAVQRQAAGERRRDGRSCVISSKYDFKNHFSQKLYISAT